MKRLVLIGLVFAMFFAIGCSGGGNGNDIPPADNGNKNDAVTGAIGSSGGILTTPSGAAAVDVPAGALSSSTTISIVFSIK